MSKLDEILKDVLTNGGSYPICEAKTPAFMPGMKRA